MTRKEILLDARTAEMVAYRRTVRLNKRAHQRALAKIKTELRRIKLGRV
jgi:hypothetical protein